MPSNGYREEVFNVLLALLLHERGVITAPEHSFRQAFEERRHVPDVLVVYLGLRTVIEGKVADKSDAEEKALGFQQIAMACYNVVQTTYAIYFAKAKP